METTQGGLERLENWKAWSKSGTRQLVARHDYPPVAPMFRDYRAGFREGEADEHFDIDINDAKAVEDKLRTMVDPLRAAVLWVYLGKKTFTVFRVELMREDQLSELVDQAARAL